MRHAEKQNAKLFLLLIGALIVLSWLAIWFWGHSPHGRFMMDQHGSEGIFQSSFVFIAVFVASWTLMIVAMMLPSSMPLVHMFQTMVCDRPHHTRLVFLLIAGYLSMWILFGLAAHLGDWSIHQAFDQSMWLRAHAWMMGTAALLLAGFYQFTPLKYHCLDKCRSPRTFIMERWQGGAEQSQAFWLGVDHGMFCIGCCWSLMMLMFTVGIGSIAWMLVLGTVMAVEKNVPWGRRLSAPLGMILILLGLTMAGWQTTFSL